jgi:hypothetical protein
MKLTSTIISLAALVSVAYADTEPVRPNSFYDNPQTSMNKVACSNGANGLVTKGYPTFGSLPSFPFIGGAFAIGAWNSTECGSCWQLTYPATGVTVHLTAIDTVFSGFDVSDETMNILTNGKTVQPGEGGEIFVQATQVAESSCGLPATV